MLALTSAWALAFYKNQLSDIPRIPLEGSLSEVSDQSEPQNFLLVGADSSAGLDASDPVNIGRNPQEQLTDTIMILRIDPNQEKAWLLSLPRDLYIPIAGNHGKDRINTALTLGGPQLLIQTIKDNFGIPINHFMQVNFLAFQELVDSVGGVNVYFNYPARDSNTGLDVETPGCRTLNGEQALQFARSRHYTAKIDGVWTEDPTSDHGRIARQQYFIKQALKKAIDKGARNPIELNSLIQVAKNYVTIDDKLTPDQILDLGSRFNSFNPDSLQVYEPYTTGGYAGAAAVLFLDPQPSQAMFDIFRGVNPTMGVVAATRVEVRNGTGKVGEGQSVGDALKRTGFSVTGVTDAADFRTDKTTIAYAPGQAGLFYAEVLSRYLDINATFKPEPELADGDHPVALIVGRDFGSVLTDPRPISDFTGLWPTAADSSATTAPTTAAPTTTAPTGKAAGGKPTTTQAATTTEPSTTLPPAPSAHSIVPDPPPGTVC
jgi:LCP family protein required for cell wall assembly